MAVRCLWGEADELLALGGENSDRAALRQLLGVRTQITGLHETGGIIQLLLCRGQVLFQIVLPLLLLPEGPAETGGDDDRCCGCDSRQPRTAALNPASVVSAGVGPVCLSMLAERRRCRRSGLL